MEVLAAGFLPPLTGGMGGQEMNPAYRIGPDQMTRPFARPKPSLIKAEVGEAVSSVDPSPDTPPPLSTDGELVGPIGPIGEGIPPHVWAVLQQAGEVAAQRLLEILAAPSFKTLPASAQRGLLELALVRAYGLPVRRAVNVNLSSTDADAVAASLADMAQHLPEVSIASEARAEGRKTGG